MTCGARPRSRRCRASPIGLCGVRWRSATASPRRAAPTRPFPSDPTPPPPPGQRPDRGRPRRRHVAGRHAAAPLAVRDPPPRPLRRGGRGARGRARARCSARRRAHRVPRVAAQLAVRRRRRRGGIYLVHRGVLGARAAVARWCGSTRPFRESSACSDSGGMLCGEGTAVDPHPANATISEWCVVVCDCFVESRRLHAHHAPLAPRLPRPPAAGASAQSE